MQTLRKNIWLIRGTTLLLMVALALMQAGPSVAALRRHESRANGLSPAVMQKLAALSAGMLLSGKPAQAPGAHNAPPVADERPLSSKEMRNLFGRGVLRNPYFAGAAQPWHRSLRDVNLCTGNLFKSSTDIQLSGGRGSALTLVRSYSSNDARVGPFGVGWGHSYDIRIEEASDVRVQNGGSSTNPADVNLVPRTDFVGAKHVYHRDADGLYSPPSYLFDQTSSTYDSALVNGPTKVTEDTQTGMDGTVKHFVNVVKTSAGISLNVRACDSITDRHGNATLLVYGVHGSYGQHITLPGTTNTQDLLSSVTDASGRTISFTWVDQNAGHSGNEAWRITQAVGPGYTVNYAYYDWTTDANHKFNLKTVTMVNSGVNRITTYDYTGVTVGANTENGLLSSISDPQGEVVSYTYTATSTPTGTAWVSQVTEPAGVVPGTSTTRNQVWTISAGSGSTSISSANGLNMTLAYDGLLRFIVSSFTASYAGRLTLVNYDTSNNVVQSRSLNHALGWLTNFETEEDYTYGPHGNVLTHTTGGFPYSEVTTYYDSDHYFKKHTFTDKNGHLTTYTVGSTTDTINNRGEILAVQDAGYSDTFSPSYHLQTAITYNSYGQKLTETNLKGVETDYAYTDTWGNLNQVTQDFGTGKLNIITNMTYDITGHVLSSAVVGGNSVQTTYYTLGQPNVVTNYDSTGTLQETTTYAYDTNGRPLTVTDHRGTITTAYEAGSDRIHSVVDSVTGTITYTYTLSGERLTMVLPGGGTWTYSYASTGNADYSKVETKDDPNSMGMLLQGITDDQGNLVHFGIDETGHIFWTTFNETYTLGSLVSYCETDNHFMTGPYSNGGMNQTYVIDQVKTTWNNSGHAQQVLAQNNYFYDNTLRNKLTNQITDSTGAVRTEHYGYDDLDRVATVDYGDGETQAYTFDAEGNRTQLVDTVSGTPTTTTYASDAVNRMTTVNGVTTAYTFDVNGNTLTGGSRTNTWDTHNRLTQSVKGANTCAYDYGADGYRRQQTVTNGTATVTRYLLDNDMMVRETLNTGVSVATYLAGPSGPLYRRADPSGVIRWYIYNGMGNVVGEVSSTGTITYAPIHDIYGKVRSSTGTATSRQSFAGALGHVTDTETGLTYMRARYYDPAIGTFLSQDPSGAGVNWYEYAGDNPVRYSDRTGKDAWDDYLNSIPPLEMATLVILNNPFAREELDSFIGMHVDQHWVNQLARDFAGVEDLSGNGIGMTIGAHFGGAEEMGPAGGVVAALTQEAMELWVGVVGVDIANEDGI